MKFLYGNLLDCDGTIVHQVNCKRTMSYGLALQIKNKFPNHFYDYMNTIPELGKILITKINSSTVKEIIAFYSQEGYGYKEAYTNYKAFENCCKLLREYRSMDGKRCPLFFPYKIGCERGNKNWNIIYPIISSYFPNAIIVIKS